MTDWKEMIRPPFANYDIVVYFGCGLFSLPLIYHYLIEPFGLRFPRFQFHIGIPFADTAISTLSLLFAVYLVGHMVAYAGSAMIEKSVDLTFGKISSAILVSNIVTSRRHSVTIRGWVARRVTKAFTRGSITSSLLRFAFFLPVLPSLVALFGLGWFDYFKTRIPPRVLSQIRKESKRRGYGLVALHTQWYKALEHDVINNRSIATARMYNYLVISGLFRSLAFLFAMCAWSELAYISFFLTGHDLIVHAIMSDHNSLIGSLAALGAFNVAFAFSLSAYVKFSRRYVEEAMFAFVLAR